MKTYRNYILLALVIFLVGCSESSSKCIRFSENMLVNQGEPILIPRSVNTAKEGVIRMGLYNGHDKTVYASINLTDCKSSNGVYAGPIDVVSEPMKIESGNKSIWNVNIKTEFSEGYYVCAYDFYDAESGSLFKSDHVFINVSYDYKIEPAKKESWLSKIISEVKYAFGPRYKSC